MLLKEEEKKIQSPIQHTRHSSTAKPEVVGSIPTQDKYLCDECEYLFCVWV